MARKSDWSGKDPSFRLLLQEVAAEADVLRAKGQGWRGDGLGDWPLSRVLWRLAEMGLPCDRDGVFHEAFEADSPYGLASLWALRTRAEGEAREFLEHAIGPIWSWCFPNGDSPEDAFLRAADLAIADECDEATREVEPLRRRHEQALAVPEWAAHARPDDPSAWVAMMEERTRVPVSEWAADLVLRLSNAKLKEEAVALADAWAPLALAERFRAETLLILATLGRRDEAHRRAEDLLRDFARSVPTLFLVGEAFILLGEQERGAEVVQRAMAYAQSREERLWVRAHFDAFGGLLDEERGFAPAVFDDEEDLDEFEVPAPIVAEERVGRNDPCPCGSGKKFKKCCGTARSS